MKIWKILISSALMAVSAVAIAGSKHHYWSNWHNGCGGGGGGTGDCVVTWDFTSTSAGKGDPLTYPGSDPAYSLVVQGFAIKKSDGTILDRSKTQNSNSGDYATDYDGVSYGIGVHAEGEDYHWGTKIDNKQFSGESMAVRDAVLLDFGSCLVSIDQIDLIKAYSGADTDFELWAYAGALNGAPPQDLTQLGDYDDWKDSASWALVDDTYSGSRYPRETLEVDILSHTPSRYFVLIAGHDSADHGDAFRMARLAVTCDPNDCEPGGGPGGEAPIPGTLALLGIGALIGRKRFLKLA